MDRAYDIIDTRNEARLRFDGNGIAKLQASDFATVAFGRLQAGEIVEKHVHDDMEANALVLSGTLTYTTGMADLRVTPGSWVVARPGEAHGFKNLGDSAVTFLKFMPIRIGSTGWQSTQIRARMFRPPLAEKKQTTIYQTSASQAFQVMLTPGSNQKVEYSRAQVVFVQEGRIMALISGKKVSLDHGEGIFIRRAAVELVGVAGTSTVAVAATRP